MATLTMFAPVASSPVELELLERGLAGLDEGDATTGDDALLDGGLRVADGVLDAVLALLELDLGGRARLDDGDAAGELGEALLELLAVVVASRCSRSRCGSAARDRRSGSGSPAPSTIVVSSLVMTTLRAWPSRSRVTFSSLRPTSSEMTWPPVRIAMSCSCALRRSPKPGALTATDLKMPRILLTIRVASASPSTSSAMMSSCLPAWITLSTIGSRSLMFEIFWLTMRMYGSSNTASWRSGSVTKYCDRKPLSKRMPSVSSSSVPKVFDSSTVTTPSLPTLSIASAMIAPIVGVAGGDGRGGRDLLLGLDLLGVGDELGDDGLDGLLDAALQADRVGAGRDVAQALADERLGEHDRRGRAVTGDVVGLLGDLLDELRADLLVRVVELDLLGDRDAVVRDRGGAPLLLEHDVAAARAERDADGVGQDVQAALEAAAGLLVESNDLCHMCFSSLPDGDGRKARIGCRPPRLALDQIEC